MLGGMIVKALSGFYYVKRDDGDEVIQCRARGLFRKQSVTPLVGDRVMIELSDDGSDGTVIDVLPRDTELVRPPIANVDTALLVFSVAEPALNLQLLDKFLAHAELARLHPVICLTKADLLEGDDDETAGLRAQLESVQSLYEAIGYPVYFTSSRAASGIGKLLGVLDGRVTVFAGQSGVGKSSLLNRLVPGLTLETNEISRKLGRGKHTTRHVELFRLGERGLVADTPGFSQLEFPEMEPERLSGAFPEMAALAQECKFRGCLHRSEPGCRVREALGSGEIASSRYEHYDVFLTEIKERKRRY
ncbi:ribosome small subunit-dependent GTPase A [Paenibacillus alkalitolerans]|uniref:ribosome small subunit-dependent GTPase A n=1 Tax=Paenibacillus alkalitolerans TaxID=2799335 RepID=UPI0018F4C9D7|nr:ribosome small subunit-dependent GTPase A [Paenibacillus alkalitolerans]